MSASLKSAEWQVAAVAVRPKAGIQVDLALLAATVSG